MLIKTAPDLRPSDVTPKALYLRRREFIQGVGGAAVATAASLVAGESTVVEAGQNPNAYRFPSVKKGSPYDTTETINSYKDITTYNNFYEFGLDKGDPARYAHSLRPSPWSVVVDGHCAKPGKMT